MLQSSTCFRWTLVVVLFGSLAHGSPPRFSFFGRKSNHTRPSSESAWSSFLTVEPSKIISILIQSGGLILPKSLQNELLSIIKVCHVDEVQWNPIQKILMLTNFTVALPGRQQQSSLRVGRMFLSWESYVKPCLNIEIDDVDVLLEFTNLLLTNTNWNELRDAGFPPFMISAENDNSSVESTSTTASYSFVRIGSIDLSGTLRVSIRSRPLNQDLSAPWQVNLDTFDEWNTELQRFSNNNLFETGRRGCTTTQVYDWIGRYVSEKARAMVLSTAKDLVSQPFVDGDDTNTVRQAKELFHGARNSAWLYVKHASLKASEDLQEKVIAKLENTAGHEKLAGALSKAIINQEDNETSVEFGDSTNQIESLFQSFRDVVNAKLLDVRGAFRAMEEADVDVPEIFPADDAV